jgi:Type II secretion system (T2SS), protein E, N-terminal domain
MKREGRGTTIAALTYIDVPSAERCNCLPLSSLHMEGKDEQEEALEGAEQIIPVTPELNSHLRTTLGTYFPRSTPLSVLLVHISQLEHIHIATKSAAVYKRPRYHAPASFLGQVLANVRRTIRTSDSILIHNGTGAAIIFPDVDREGGHNILERVYHSINLLQSETVIPPLKRETDILIGLGSYPKPGSSLESLLYHTGLVARRLRFRPAVTPLTWSIKSSGATEEITHGRPQDDDEQALLNQARSSGIPFMQLPVELPARLKQLIPYQLALEIRCAPVGRDHNRLTVAMANPTNRNAVRHLKETTGMIIFPVSCELAALDALLANGW